MEGDDDLDVLFVLACGRSELWFCMREEHLRKSDGEGMVNVSMNAGKHPMQINVYGGAEGPFREGVR